MKPLPLRPFPITAFALWLAVMPAAPAEKSRADFADRFADPPADTRILKIIHGWPDAPEAQDSLIAQLRRQGFGGVVCNVSFTDYLESDARWSAFERAVRTARAAGLAMWLYDEHGYPSGNAGGLVLRDHPEWEARGLLALQREVGAGVVELALPPGKPVLTAAFPMRDGRLNTAGRIELGGHIRDGQLRWEAPEGRWQIMLITEDRLYDGTHAEGNLHEKMPYVNLLQPEPTARFLELTHDRYAARLGPDLGRYFEALFTDEPSLMSCFLRPMPWRPLPWAPNLPREFQQRRGYPLDATVLPSLLAEAGPATAKQRHDFWLTVGELVATNYFGQIRAWGRRHNLPSGGHLLAEEGLAVHVPFYGDFFRCAREFDAPSIDCLTSLPSEVPWQIARLVASAGELEGRTLMMSETSDHGQVWRAAGDTRPKRIVTEAEIRGTCNRLIVAGVNCITSYYSFADLSDEQLRRLNEWVGRCCLALRGGHQVADIALLYPIESVWTKFTPARQWANESPGAARIETTWRAAAESLFAARRDFTFVDSRALAEARIEGDALAHGPLRWRVVVLAGADTLPRAAWDNLARFAAAGGVVIALDARPLNSDTDFPSPRAQAVGRELFGEAGAGPGIVRQPNGGAGIFLPQGTEGLLPLVLDRVLEPDTRISERAAPIRVTHRRLEGREVYLVINDSPKPWSGTIQFAAEGGGEIWDPTTGRRAESFAGDEARLSLEAYGATLVRFPAARRPARRTVETGPLPGLTLRPTPVTEPASSHGEFVRASLAPDPKRSREGAPAWRLEGALTKSRVDTFHFANFRHEPLLDLAEADCVVLDTWAPSGQGTPTQLLVILAEEGGEDFIAPTGRSLAVAGPERSFIPLPHFQRAGWSQPGDGVLDPARVREIRVGWGGYLGTEGERVVFSVSLPRLGSPSASPR